MDRQTPGDVPEITSVAPDNSVRSITTPPGSKEEEEFNEVPKTIRKSTYYTGEQ